MDPIKIGNFIKKLRKDNNLTQKELANKYNVTYQAVSKWENGINLPDIALLKQMSKDFNISIENILDGKKTIDKRKKFIIIGIILIIVLAIFIIYILINTDKSFSFKTITTTCEQFKVSGSIAYDKNKSSIYISHIDYCGGEDNTIYQNIECNLYEKENDIISKISSCKSRSDNISLEKYLKDIEFKVDNYKQVCSKYNNNTLYLEINATDKDNKVTTYKIPLSLNSNC